MSPFKALYDREACELPHYKKDDTIVDAVKTDLQLREENLANLKTNMLKAQKKMKDQADNT